MFLSNQSKEFINHIGSIMPMIELNTMPFKYGAFLINGKQIVNIATNSPRETQFNGLTGCKEDVSSVHAEQDCLFSFLNTIEKGRCLL